MICLAIACGIGVLAGARAPQAPTAAPAATLVGWATLPIDTFAPGPTTGQFAGAGQFGHTLPVVDKQVVQGFSAVINGPAPGTFYVLMDNGFGTKANSADSLLRVYTIRPTFRTATGGDAAVGAAHFRTGAALTSFTADSFIALSDPDRKLGFPITADQTTYYARPDAPAVAPAIRQGRLLTGADLDPESFRRTPDGHFWFGDEFGPFLFETDTNGRVLRAPIALDGVFAAENPHRGERPANLGSSRGYEGLALSPKGDLLFALLEGVVTGEPAGLLRINEFSVSRGAYTGRTFKYRLDALGTNIGDMTAVNDHEFAVVERNGGVGDNATPPAFKKIFRIDSSRLDADGAAAKTEVADLMNVADPDDLNRDGKTTFTFPFVTIEDVLVIDANTILVINDNNYPGGGGRGQTSDATEVLLIRLGAARSAGDNRGAGESRSADDFRGPSGAGGIDGSIRRSQGRVVPDAKVTARAYDSGRVWRAAASAIGRFEFRDLPAGSYRLDVDSVEMNGGTRMNRVQVRQGEVTSVELNAWSGVICECVIPPFNPSDRTIDVRGRLMDEYGNPLPHAVVIAKDADWGEGDYSDLDGQFQLRLRPRQLIELTARYPGHVERTMVFRTTQRGRYDISVSLTQAADHATEPATESLGDGCHCFSSFVHRRQ